MLAYGIIMGTCNLMTFIFIVYGPGPNGLGDDCNKGYNASCDVVFRARAAVFAELTWMILIAAWEFKSLRRSMFALDPDNSTDRFLFFKDVYANKFLFWSVVVGALSVFPAVYIPGLNRTVFKHTGISWEWAVVIVCVILFVSGIETWKLVTRTIGWFAEAETESRNEVLSSRPGFFTLVGTLTRTETEDDGMGEKATVDLHHQEPSRIKEEV